MSINEESLLKQMSPETQQDIRAEIERINAAMNVISLAGPALLEAVTLARDTFAKFGQSLTDLDNALKAYVDFIEDASTEHHQ